MEHPGFFDRAGPFSVGELAKAVGAEIAGGADPEAAIEDVRPLSDAGPRQLDVHRKQKVLRPARCDCSRRMPYCAAYCAARPGAHRGAYCRATVSRVRTRHADILSTSRFPMTTRAGAPPIDPTARLETGVSIEPGAVIGPEVEIGSGTRIAAGAVIGARCAIGRDGYIGPLTTVTHALIGDRVIIHSGVRIGQDGFGFAMGRTGHLKVPQIGRVIIQDDVEIGANSTVDRAP